MPNWKKINNLDRSKRGLTIAPDQGSFLEV